MSHKFSQNLECLKGGLHQGQRLNLVCLQPQCMQKSLICGVCLAQQHSGHKMKSLKGFLLQATNSVGSSCSQLSGIQTQQVINKKKSESTEYLKQFEVNEVQNAKKGIIQYEDIEKKLIEQIKKKIDCIKQLQHHYKIITQTQSLQQFKLSIKQIISVQPYNRQELTHQFIKKTVQRHLQSLYKIISTRSVTALTILNKLQQYFTNLIRDFDIFTKIQSHRFSQSFKHTSISLQSQNNKVKSQSGYTYRYCLLQPSLETTKGLKKIALKIILSSSNWVAVGICHKQTVIKKNYGFNYSQIGHGGYLISANGGSWSNIQSFNNNIIKAFNFTTGDILILQYDSLNQKIKFTKELTKQTYSLKFNYEQNNQLFFCVMFYYTNDVIEYLPDYSFS